MALELPVTSRHRPGCVPVHGCRLGSGGFRPEPSLADLGAEAPEQRRQQEGTFDTKGEALAELSRVRHQMQRGTFVARSVMTVNDLVEVWIASVTRDVEEGSASNYDSAIRPARDHLA